MATDLVVIHSPVGGGHKAAALALVSAARARGLSCELLDTFEHAPRVVGKSYVAAHLAGQSAMPELYGSAYYAANHRGGLLEPVRRAVDHVTFAALVRRVIDLQPRAVIATHHLPLVVLGRARRTAKLDAPLLGVVTDYTAHACWAEPGVDGFAVACERAGAELAGHGIARDRIAITGIPVRAAFDQIRAVREPSEATPLRVLITSGGFGVGPMRAIVRSFAGRPNVELTVVCGNAAKLVETVTADAREAGIAARVIGFEKDMAARVAEAHLVVGKAGGLTVSETMSAGRPMIIVGAVPGNEKVNEELVVGCGAGFAARPFEVGALASWMREGRMIEAMGARARALVVHRSADNVIDLAARLVWERTLPRAA